ncbi:MAG: hypothetical protein JNM34_06020 [Chthonomonadaceae bacterium]|nr:hypothetical protein [Chthonomonadaceae bacterium]
MKLDAESIQAYADGELTETEVEAAAGAIANDPHAAAELEWATMTKSLLKSKVTSEFDPALWAKCRDRLDAIDKTKTTEAFVGKYAWALCLVFLAGILSAAFLNRAGAGRPLSTDHMASLFNGLTPFSFTGSQDAIDNMRSKVGMVPSQLPNVARCVAAATGSIDGRRVGRFILDDGRGFVTLFVIEGTNGVEGLSEADQSYQCGNINDAAAVSWKQSGYLCLLVGPRNIAELKNLGNVIQSQ